MIKKTAKLPYPKENRLRFLSSRDEFSSTYVTKKKEFSKINYHICSLQSQVYKMALNKNVFESDRNIVQWCHLATTASKEFPNSFITTTFEFKSENVVLTLFNALVRRYLTYCVKFLLRYYRKDTEKLERI